MDLCNAIIRRKLAIIWDTPSGLWVNSLREEIVAKMAEAGLVRACLAIEHGDDYIRNKVIKKWSINILGQNVENKLLEFINKEI